MSRQQRRRIGLVFLLLLIAGVAVGLYLSDGRAEAGTSATAPATSEDKEPENAPVPVRVSAVDRGRVSSYLSATANLVAENQVTILAEADGRITELKVDEGASVAKGQLLAAIDPDAARIALKKAELRASDARMAYERAERTFAQDLISQADFDKVKLDDQIAQQELAEARFQLEKTGVRAPFGGRVVRREVQLGQHVSPGAVLFEVADFDPLVARIYLPEREVLRLRPGQPVSLSLKADEDLRFAGRIQQISPVVDVDTGTVKVTVEAVAPPPEVRPGAFVNVEVVRETREAALLIPRDAVVRELQRAYVFVAMDGVAHKRTVELGLEEHGRVEALSGLSAGEQVVIAGQGSLKDGAAVQVLGAEADTASADLGTPAEVTAGR